MTDVLDGPNDSREMPQEGYQQLSPRSSEKNTVGIMRDPPRRQLNRAIEVARKIAAAAPLGIRATLGSAHRALTDGEEAAFVALLPELGQLAQSEDHREYFRALRERRAPVYRCR